MPKGDLLENPSVMIFTYGGAFQLLAPKLPRFGTPPSGAGWHPGGIRDSSTFLKADTKLTSTNCFLNGCLEEASIWRKQQKQQQQQQQQQRPTAVFLFLSSYHQRRLAMEPLKRRGKREKATIQLQVANWFWTSMGSKTSHCLINWLLGDLWGFGSSVSMSVDVILLKLYLYLRGTFSYCEPVRLQYTQGSKSCPYFRNFLASSWLFCLWNGHKSQDKWLNKAFWDNGALSWYHVFPFSGSELVTRTSTHLNSTISTVDTFFVSKAISDSHLLT